MAAQRKVCTLCGCVEVRRGLLLLSPLSAHVTAPGNQCQPRWASASDNETKLWWTCVTEREIGSRRNREYALCIYATEYFPHVSESYRERFSCFQSILFVLKLPYVCLLPSHISLSLIYHLAMYFCTWQGMVYVRFGHYSITLSSRALDVECDVSKLCWIFCIFVPVTTYTIIF